MAAPTRKSSLPSHNPTQLSVISEEASQYGDRITISPSTSPIPPLPPEDQTSLPRPNAPEPPDEPDTPRASTVSRATQTPTTSEVPAPLPPTPAPSQALTTLTVAKRRSKRKRFVEAIRKKSAEFVESFKAHDFSKHRQEMNDVFALIYGTGATTTKQQQKIAILRIRKLQERGVEWWVAVTRAAQHKIDPPTDSLEDLLEAIKRGEDAVLKSQEFDKRRKGKYAGIAYEPEQVRRDNLYFRCDIHAADAKDYHDAEAECKQLVVEAGGKVLDEYEFVGGFLYSLPAHPNFSNPLANGDETLLGGYICIKPWSPFSPPDAKSTGANANEVNELEGSTFDPKEWPRATTETSERKMQDWILEQRKKVDEGAAVSQTEGKVVERSEDEDEDDIVLSPRILDPGVELAILEPGRLLFPAPSRPSSMHMAVQTAGSGQEEEQERSWLDIDDGEASDDGGVSIVGSDYDEDAVVLEASTAIRACASPVFVRRGSKL